MISIAVGHLREATGARLICGPEARNCHGCVIDSRQVERDSIFVAFPGERVDGNDFAPKAIESGAAAVVMTREPAQELVEAANAADAAILVTDDPTEFLLRLAHDYRTALSACVIGITGSIGKTTTKDVLCALLSTRYRVYATKANHNNLIGLPMTILAAPADTEMLVLEMGMNHLHEIERLSKCAEPSFAVITKVGTSHIGILGSRENIARAKSEILCGMKATEDAPASGSALILNGEDDFTPFIRETFADPAGVDVELVGFNDADSVSASDVVVDEDGCPRLTIAFPDGSTLDTKLSIMGAQSVPNALYAAALAFRLGVTPSQIDTTFRNLRVTGRRQEIRHAACGARIIDDTYNASPESMAAGLDLLCSLPCSGSRIAVLGEMGELGDESARLHELTGAYAAAKKLDFIVFVGGENAGLMARAATLMGADEDRVRVVDTWKSALDEFSGAIEPDDLVLVKASRFVELDRFVEGVC